MERSSRCQRSKEGETGSIKEKDRDKINTDPDSRRELTKEER